MTTSTDDARLGRLEGRLEEQSATLQDLKEGQREISARLDTGLQQVNSRIDTGLQQVNSRIDQVNDRIDACMQEIRSGQRQILLAMMTFGAALTVTVLGLIATLALKGG